MTNTMANSTTIIIAVIALVSSIVSAIITAVTAAAVALHSDRVRRLSETEKLVAKYRDPLLLASMELQSRLYNILEGNFLSYYEDGDETKRELVVHYTAFLFGQFFSWTYILHRKVQFLQFSTDAKSKELSRAVERLQGTLSTDKYGQGQSERLFMLWRGQQKAIGEIMTIVEGGELFCIGYSKFLREISNPDQNFSKWFEPIEGGIRELVAARSAQRPVRAEGPAEGPAEDPAEVPEVPEVPANRLRRLQHLLLDLISVLDPHYLGVGTTNCKRARATPTCECVKCGTAAGQNGASGNQISTTQNFEASANV